jgi:hypothetical protein
MHSAMPDNNDTVAVRITLQANGNVDEQLSIIKPISYLLDEGVNV